MNEKGRGCRGSACERLFFALLDWLPSSVCRNTSALKHADPCTMHGLIAWLSSTKLCGAEKCLTKSRNKLRQAATEKLGCECVVDGLCGSVRSRTLDPDCATGDTAHGVVLQWLRKRLTWRWKWRVGLLCHKAG
jgi:hypothetical protein